MAERQRKLGERILRYIKQPKLFLGYARYLLDELCARWPKKEMSIYVLEMKIPTTRAEKTLPVVKRINSLEPLMDFISLREQEDPIWHGNYLNELKERFEKGNLCFATFDNERVISTLFVTFGGYYFAELDYALRFPEGVFGVIDVYTLKDYRGTGCYGKAFKACASDFAGSEFEKLYGFIAPDNKVSLMTHNRLGLNHIIMKVSMYQHWGFRRHTVEKMDTYIENIYNFGK